MEKKSIIFLLLTFSLSAAFAQIKFYQDGAVKFGRQDGWKVAASVSYHEWKAMTNGIYQIYTDQNAYIPGLSLNFFPQFQYKDLESWGGHQLHTMNLDTNFDLLHSEKFTTSTGFDGVVISGERNLTGLGSSEELLIMIDLTTPAWKERYDENEFADPDGWLGVMIMSSGEDYSTVMSVVESIDFDETYVPEAYPFEEIGTSEVMGEIILNELYQDGAVKFGRQDGWKVAASVSYHEWKAMTNGIYQIYTDQNAYIPGKRCFFRNGQSVTA